jgi:hypothetical protein
MCLMCLVLHGSEWSASLHGHFTAGEEGVRTPGIHGRGGREGLRIGLEAVAKKKKKKISASVGNRKQVVQPAA